VLSSWIKEQKKIKAKTLHLPIMRTANYTGKVLLVPRPPLEHHRVVASFVERHVRSQVWNQVVRKGGHPADDVVSEWEIEKAISLPVRCLKTTRKCQVWNMKMEKLRQNRRVLADDVECAHDDHCLDDVKLNLVWLGLDAHHIFYRVLQLRNKK